MLDEHLSFASVQEESCCWLPFFFFFFLWGQFLPSFLPSFLVLQPGSAAELPFKRPFKTPRASRGPSMGAYSDSLKHSTFTTIIQLWLKGSALLITS